MSGMGWEYYQAAYQAVLKNRKNLDCKLILADLADADGNILGQFIRNQIEIGKISPGYCIDNSCNYQRNSKMPLVAETYEIYRQNGSYWLPFIIVLDFVLRNGFIDELILRGYYKNYKELINTYPINKLTIKGNSSLNIDQRHKEIVTFGISYKYKEILTRMSTDDNYEKFEILTEDNIVVCFESIYLRNY
jgi:hypothetical protein